MKIDATAFKVEPTIQGQQTGVLLSFDQEQGEAVYVFVGLEMSAHMRRELDETIQLICANTF